MRSASRVRSFGLVCLIGGLLWSALNITEALRVPPRPSILEDLLGVLMLLGLVGGPLGLIVLRAAGRGRGGQIGLAGAIVALLGLLSYLAGMLYGLAALESALVNASYALGALLVGLGMLPLGISTIVAPRLSGWRLVAPLLVGLYYAAMIPVQLFLFIGPTGKPSTTLLALWGLTWAALGYAIFSEAKEWGSEQTGRERSSVNHTARDEHGRARPAPPEHRTHRDGEAPPGVASTPTRHERRKGVGM